jgi:hypothetical protein
VGGGHQLKKGGQKEGNWCGGVQECNRSVVLFLNTAGFVRQKRWEEEGLLLHKKR